MKGEGKRKLLNTFGTIAKLATKFIVPGGAILDNFTTHNAAPTGKYDTSRSWPDVALELGKIIIWVLALYYLGIEVAI